MIDQDDEQRIVALLKSSIALIQDWDRLAGGRWEYRDLKEILQYVLKIMEENGVRV